MIGVGQVIEFTGGGTSGTSGTVTTAAGSGFLLFFMHNVALNTYGDSKGNPYTEIATELVRSGSDRIRAFYAPPAASTAGAGHSFSWTTLSSAFVGGFLVEITDADPTNFLDNAGTPVNDNSSPYTPTSITPNIPITLLVSYMCGTSPSNPATMVESTGFSIAVEQTDGSTKYPHAVATKRVTSNASVGASWTQSGMVGGNAAMLLFSIREAGQGGRRRRRQGSGGFDDHEGL